MKDFIGTSPLTGVEESCYITPINEKLFSYRCLATGFQSSDLWVEGEFDFTEFESTLPELYKAIKIKDEQNRVWYPQVINQENKGIVFIIGTNPSDWEWAASLHVPVPEEEKERFKRPDGSYAEFKNDPKTLKKFKKTGFIDALSYIGVLS